VLKSRGTALGVALHARGILDAQLLGHIVDDLGRHIQRVIQKRAQIPDGNQLHGEPEHQVRAVAPLDKPLVFIIEIEQLFQHRPGQWAAVAAIPGRLLIGRELNRHAATT